MEDQPNLCDIVYRIRAVLRLLFSSSTHYKAFITADEKIFRDGLSAPGKRQSVPQIDTPVARIGVACPKCGKSISIFGRFGPIPKQLDNELRKKATPFPASNKVTCECGFQIDVTALRNQLEDQVGQRLIDNPAPTDDNSNRKRGG